MVIGSSFYRNVGLVGGSLWMVSVGTVFAGWSLIAVGSVLARCWLTVLLAAALAMVTFGIQLIAGLRRVPHEPPVDRNKRRMMAREFGMIVAAEGFACGGIALMCMSTHRWKLIVPLTLVVVGLHFLPLARLFQVPRYNVTGALFCIIPMATVLFVPSSARVGHAVAWIAIPAVGCALVAVATAAGGFREVRRFVNRPSGQLPGVLVSSAHSA